MTCDKLNDMRHMQSQSITRHTFSLQPLQHESCISKEAAEEIDAEQVVEVAAKGDSKRKA